eukprot:4908220-Amphidinium_carterae.2
MSVYPVIPIVSSPGHAIDASLRAVSTTKMLLSTRTAPRHLATEVPQLTPAPSAPSFSPPFMVHYANKAKA